VFGATVVSNKTLQSCQTNKILFRNNKMTDYKHNNSVGGEEMNEGKKELWWAAFPQPKASVPELTGDELMTMFDDMDIKPEHRSFLLVDVRRTDWEVRVVFIPETLSKMGFIGSDGG
jgi:hypothetical protein